MRNQHFSKTIIKIYAGNEKLKRLCKAAEANLYRYPNFLSIVNYLVNNGNF